MVVPKALRAFSWFLGARRRTGMSDCFGNVGEETGWGAIM